SRLLAGIKISHNKGQSNYKRPGPSFIDSSLASNYPLLDFIGKALGGTARKSLGRLKGGGTVKCLGDRTRLFSLSSHRKHLKILLACTLQSLLVIPTTVWSTPERPLVFIPGILGSVLEEKGEVIWGDIRSLNRLSRLRITDGPKDPNDGLMATK